MSLQLNWMGVDGSVWDLRSGPVRGGLGIKGLGIIPLKTTTQDSASLDGQRRTGWRAAAAPVLLPVKLGYYGVGDFPDFRSLRRAWWKSVRPHQYGTLQAVDTYDGTARTIALRLEDDGREMEYDPDDVQLEDSVLQFVADDPWWYGDPVSAGFGAVSAGNYYGGPNGGGYGPPYYISSANSTGGQTVQNPGDIDAWPIWTIFGPFTGLDLAVGSAHIQGSGLNVLAGQQVIIDTDPQHGQTAYWLDANTNAPIPDSGSPSGNITRRLSAVNFAPIPAGSSTAVSATITGTGQATTVFLPRYFDGE